MLSKARYWIHIGLQGHETKAFPATTYNLVGNHLFFRGIDKTTHNILLGSNDHVHVIGLNEEK